MQLKLYKALWGMPGTYASQLQQAKEEGYDGIEAPLPPVADEAAFKGLLETYELDYIAQIVTAEEHIASFAEQVKRVTEFNPQLIVSHSAKDWMPEAETDRFFEAALKVEQQYKLPIGHETHRARAMFSPWSTARLLKKFPELRITADFSHWCNVCESMLEDQEDTMRLAIKRATHVHGRVGHAEGPQVSHPAAPEYAYETSRFLTWWGQIAEAMAAAGNASMSLTPEFGPPGYMPQLPFTKQAVAELNEVNQWIAEQVRSQFALWL
ncbi:sugar phosphate isomerase/epimerase family protein [Paenibacillus glycanilyticus]|uniref:sugar phosphate isomerase/epimerase family protein n=1 Tax=Paenibacillus glycanilyticus TaxID=126569 RepID=UPI000FDCCF46|nr:TIM barrel protein [Paenibacillus glycanilyticus]